jgi:hypothetical protein
MKLLFDPFFQADFADFFDVGGARTVGQAIHGVQDGFVFGELADGEFAFEFFVEGDVFASAGCAERHIEMAAGLGVVCGAGVWDRADERDDQRGCESGCTWGVEAIARRPHSLFVHCWSLGAHGALRNNKGFCFLRLV